MCDEMNAQGSDFDTFTADEAGKVNEKEIVKCVRKSSEAQSIDIAGARAQYDECAKNILAHKSFLARILKGTVKELAQLDVETIIRECLTEEPAISTVPVDRDVAEISKVESANVEDKTVTEGETTFDLKLNVRVPGEGEIKLIINLESQKDAVKYPVEKRAIYYTSRLISAQKGVVFESDDYEKIRKVYSIWIRMNVGEEQKNTVTLYNLAECDIIGSRKVPKEDYDLINVIMIGLGDYKKAEMGSMLRMLDVIFAAQMEPEDKKGILSQEYKIPMTKEIREVDTMCNLSEGIYEQGIAQGIEQGENLKAVEAARNFLRLRKVSIEEISMCIGLSVEEVKKIEEEMCVVG